MNKWTYKNIKWLYYLIMEIRLFWHINIGNIKNAEHVITEHMEW